MLAEHFCRPKSAQRNSVTHLGFICTPVSDAILSDCHLWHSNKTGRAERGANVLENQNKGRLSVFHYSRDSIPES